MSEHNLDLFDALEESGSGGPAQNETDLPEIPPELRKHAVLGPLLEKEWRHNRRHSSYVRGLATAERNESVRAQLMDLAQAVRALEFSS